MADIPIVAVQRVAGPETLLAEIGIVVIRRRGDQLTGLVERLASPEIDGAADAAFNKVGAWVLEDVDAGEEVSRDVFEVQSAAVSSGKDVAAVEFRANPRKSANEHAAALGRKPRRIARFVGPLQGDSGDALERFGDRAVGQRANVLRSDGIDHLLGILLAVAGAAQRSANASDDNRVLAGRGFRRSLVRCRLGGRGGLRCRLRERWFGRAQRHRKDRHAGQKPGRPAVRPIRYALNVSHVIPLSIPPAVPRPSDSAKFSPDTGRTARRRAGSTVPAGARRPLRKQVMRAKRIASLMLRPLPKQAMPWSCQI